MRSPPASRRSRTRWAASPRSSRQMPGFLRRSAIAWSCPRVSGSSSRPRRGSGWPQARGRDTRWSSRSTRGCTDSAAPTSRRSRLRPLAVSIPVADRLDRRATAASAPASLEAPSGRRRLRLLVLIDGLGWGGAEMLLPDLVRAARIAGIDVSVAYLREKDGSPAARRLRALGVDPVWLGVGGLLKPASLRKVHRHVAAVQPDVVHSHLGYSDLLGGLAAGALGVPVISTIHVTRWDESIRGRVKSALFDATRRATANRVITVSDAARVAFLEQGWGPRRRVMTMHNCIAGDVRPGTGRQVRAELGIGPDQLVVGMVSVLRHGKGHRVAARAMERVRMRVPEARLVVLGDGPARADVETALAPLRDGAVMAGHRDDVMDVLDAVDVFLLPSEHEAFPTALLEAMAAG